MMLFAISGDLLTMFIAWEFLGITSYLLIGFWHGRKTALYSARKSITTIVIGDLLFLIAIAVIFSSYHTLNIQSLISLNGSANLTFALCLLLVAALTKSAQFPFHEWLADAMDAPTPVSAFLHSSTMIKAGVFIVILLLPLYINANLLPVILVIGVISAVIAIMNALSEHNLKKILAYSTIEDIGLMFIALGLNAPFAAVVLFAVQTFYKALLFMDTGAIIKANKENMNIYETFNIRSNKLLFATMLIGVLSIIGVIPFSGFFGKVSLFGFASTNIYVYAGLIILQMLSSIYIFRFLIVPSRTSKTAKIPATNYKLVPKSMVVGISVGVFLALASGFLFFVLPKILGFSQPNLDTSTIVFESIAIAVGFGIAYLLYVKGFAPKASEDTVKYGLLHNSYFINVFYKGVASAFSVIAHGLEEFDSIVDRNIDLGGHGVVLFGNLVRKIENGNLNVYVVVFVLGIIALIVLFGLGLLGVL
jgi:NADH-quinone oxidoreductase subunit L